MGVRFLHASDLHFGSYQTQNSTRAYDFLYCLEQLLDIAIKEKVNFILWGGDVFDSQELLPQTLLDVFNIIEQFQKLSNYQIPIIAIEGNHDLRRYYKGMTLSRPQSWLRILSNRKLIILLDGEHSDETDLITNFATTSSHHRPLTKGEEYLWIDSAQQPKVRIIGYRYIGEQCDNYLPCIAGRIAPLTDCFTILLLHCGVQDQMYGVPGVQLSSFQCLKDRVDYIALGHYHLSYRLNNWIFNPGSTEAKSSMESQFKRGIFLIEISEKNRIQTVRHIALKNRLLLSFEIVLSKGYFNSRELKSAIVDSLSKKLLPFNSNLNRMDLNIPSVSVVLRGFTLKHISSTIISQLREQLIQEFAVIDIHIYDKTQAKNFTLNTFLSPKNNERKEISLSKH